MINISTAHNSKYQDSVVNDLHTYFRQITLHKNGKVLISTRAILIHCDLKVVLLSFTLRTINPNSDLQKTSFSPTTNHNDSLKVLYHSFLVYSRNVYVTIYTPKFKNLAMEVVVAMWTSIPRKMFFVMASHLFVLHE